MSEIDDGGPAFPSHGSMGEVVHSGMSRRDWLAGLAMQALMDPRYVNALESAATKYGVSQSAGLAQAAYQQADAMIAEGRK